MTELRKNHKTPRRRAREFRKALLSWYDREGRELPWRYKGGAKPDPYKVWLSEIMLQQTTVAAVIPYFLKFTRKWPDIHALAGANIDDVMKEWAGLGYYARARNLHKCAKIISGDCGGVFPDTVAALKKLPGIGDYTAAAIAAIVYNRPVTVADANVERVMARVLAFDESFPAAKKKLVRKAGVFFENHKERAGDFPQALMDLGAMLCTSKNPRCAVCPVSAHCRGREQGIEQSLPVIKKPGKKPQKYGHVYWITNGRGEVLVHRRPQSGILGGMAGLPTSAWVEEKGDIEGLPILKDCAFPKATGKRLFVAHSFTHFDLRLELKKGAIKKSDIRDRSYLWRKAGHLPDLGFPTLFRKALGLFINPR